MIVLANVGGSTTSDTILWYQSQSQAWNSVYQGSVRVERMGENTPLIKNKTKDTQCRRRLHQEYKIFAAGLGCKRTTIVKQFAWDNYDLSAQQRDHQRASENGANKIYGYRIAEETRRKFAWALTGLQTIMMTWLAASKIGPCSYC